MLLFIVSSLVELTSIWLMRCVTYFKITHGKIFLFYTFLLLWIPPFLVACLCTLADFQRTSLRSGAFCIATVEIFSLGTFIQELFGRGLWRQPLCLSPWLKEHLYRVETVCGTEDFPGMKLPSFLCTAGLYPSLLFSNSVALQDMTWMRELYKGLERFVDIIPTEIRS